MASLSNFTLSSQINALQSLVASNMQVRPERQKAELLRLNPIITKTKPELVRKTISISKSKPNLERLNTRRVQNNHKVERVYDPRQLLKVKRKTQNLDRLFTHFQHDKQQLYRNDRFTIVQRPMLERVVNQNGRFAVLESGRMVSNQVFSANQFGAAALTVNPATETTNALINLRVEDEMGTPVSILSMGQGVSVSTWVDAPALLINSVDVGTVLSDVDATLSDHSGQLTGLWAATSASGAIDLIQSAQAISGSIASLWPKKTSAQVGVDLDEFDIPSELQGFDVDLDSMEVDLTQGLLSMQPSGSWTNAAGQAISRAVDWVRVNGNFFSSGYSQLGGSVPGVRSILPTDTKVCSLGSNCHVYQLGGVECTDLMCPAINGISVGKMVNRVVLERIPPIENRFNSIRINSGGSGRGVGLTDTDGNNAIYFAQGGNTSWGGATAVQYGGVTYWAQRYRCTTGTFGGFIWENSTETGLMALNSASGNLTVKGSVSSASLITSTINGVRMQWRKPVLTRQDKVITKAKPEMTKSYHEIISTLTSRISNAFRVNKEFLFRNVERIANNSVVSSTVNYTYNTLQKSFDVIISALSSRISGVQRTVKPSITRSDHREISALSSRIVAQSTNPSFTTLSVSGTAAINGITTLAGAQSLNFDIVSTPLGQPGTLAGSRIRLYASNATPSTNDYAIGVDGSQLWINTHSSARISFSMGATERAFVNSSGLTVNDDLVVNGVGGGVSVLATASYSRTASNQSNNGTFTQQPVANSTFVTKGTAVLLECRVCGKTSVSTAWITLDIGVYKVSPLTTYTSVGSEVNVAYALGDETHLTASYWSGLTKGVTYAVNVAGVNHIASGTFSCNLVVDTIRITHMN